MKEALHNQNIFMIQQSVLQVNQPIGLVDEIDAKCGYDCEDKSDH